MSNMVERVARAIEATYEQFADPTPAQRARAAIEAMREPTEAMVERGEGYSDQAYAWGLMIDEALNAEESK